MTVLGSGGDNGSVLRFLFIVMMDSGYVSLLVPKQLQGHKDAFLRGTFASSGIHSWLMLG